MRLMFIGSIPGHVPGQRQQVEAHHQPLFEAARQLGYAAAERNHRILIGSKSERTIDYYLVQGIKSYCEGHPKEFAHIEAHFPEDEVFSYEALPTNLHVLPIAHYADPNSANKWTVAHARAVDAADIVIAVGGGASTRLFGHLAADWGKTIVAIPSFGGSASELFEKLKYKYQGEDKGSQFLPLVRGLWTKDSAAGVLRFAELLASKVVGIWNTYFISYSWHNCDIADHLEILLRRENRPVLRDEVDVRAAAALSESIKSLIEKCDTFLCVWSKSYKNSSWCPQELEFALTLRNQMGTPKRIIALRADEESLPLRLTDQLHLDVKDRDHRKLAVNRLVKEE